MLIMSHSLNDSLHNIAKGSTIVFAGVIASLALNFLLRVALVRYTTEDMYGLYSLAITIVGVVGAIAMLGLDEGSARYIAYYAGKTESSRAGKIASATLKITLASGMVFAALLFVFSDAVAVHAFHTPALGGILKIMAAAVPLTVLLQILTAVMRGYNDTWSRAFFRDTLRTLLFLGFLAGIILLNLPFDSIIYAYVLSMALALAALAFFSVKRLPRQDTGQEGRESGVVKSLLSFSLPMLSISLLMLMMSQATALLLAFFTNPADVGKYDIAVTMASLLLVVINSLGYIYTPTVSGLYGKGRLSEVRQSYVTSTRWGYVLTLPVLFIFLLFPGELIGLLFGERYASVALILQIIAIGYLINPLTGPNYHTLIAAGRTREITESFLVNAVSNVLLCLVLIPLHGIVGAALAATLSSMTANLLLSVRLYQRLKIHPLTRNYLLTIGSSIALLAGFYVTLKTLSIQPSIFVALACTALYVAAYAVSLILLRTITDDDILILSAIEKKLGVKIIPMIQRQVR